MSNSNNVKDVADTYQKRAPRYNRYARRFDFFAWLGFNLSGWPRQAISALNLKPGNTVVDIGCGTGLNFPLLNQVVTSSGTIIAVDLSDAIARPCSTDSQSQAMNEYSNCVHCGRSAHNLNFHPKSIRLWQWVRVAL